MGRNNTQVRCIRLYPLAIPLKKAFHHAAHTRQTTDSVIVEVELADAHLGFGETLPRPYVSGETTASVVADIRDVFLHRLLAMRPGSFAEALEQIDALPACHPDGRPMTAARAGLELALLDAYSRSFHKPLAEVAGWFGVPGFGPPGSLRRTRYSGVLSGGDPARLPRTVRLMRLYRLRDFKLKVGYDDDAERIRLVARLLGRGLGRALSLRLDANGAWTLSRALEVLEAVRDLPIAAVEQPLPRENDADLISLRQAVEVPVILDESLVTEADASRLVDMGAAGGFNIRISKNGGFLPALRLAQLARRHGLILQLGCMVGETSILSAAGRHFLANVPGIRFAEGSYGTRLLTADIVRRRVQFGFGGRPTPLSGPGWGVEVIKESLRTHVRPGMIEFAL